MIPRRHYRRRMGFLKLILQQLLLLVEDSADAHPATAVVNTAVPAEVTVPDIGQVGCGHFYTRSSPSDNVSYMFSVRGRFFRLGKKASS